MFLYPHLGIKRGGSITPVETYMSWKDLYALKDHKLIAVYHLRDDQEFKIFEEKMLLNNRLFETFQDLEDEKRAYIFDYSRFDKDFRKIINGKYSLLSDSYKSTVLNYYQGHRHVESYLYPNRYYNEYASLLSEKRDFSKMKELLMNVKELCPLPDLSKETFGISEKVATFENINKM